MTIEWIYAKDYVPYSDAEFFMQNRVIAIQNDQKQECVWLLEHPPLYTAGSSAKPCDVLNASMLPIIETRRGGQYTYHGPGQRICYLMLDLNRRKNDLRQYVTALEQLGIDALAFCGVNAMRNKAGVGLWIKDSFDNLFKIAAIGVRVSKWVTSYGIAFNIFPNLDHYKGIVPCGIRDHGVTSLQKLGCNIAMKTFDTFLKTAFENNTFLKN